MVDTSLARWLADAEILRFAQDDSQDSVQAFLDKCHRLRYNMNERSFILVLVHSYNSKENNS